jgi:hypothetical protein
LVIRWQAPADLWFGNPAQNLGIAKKKVPFKDRGRRTI